MALVAPVAPISVVVPCFRCRDTIERSLQSIFAQTLQPSEILLVDDASGDGSVNLLHELAQRHAPRVRVIALEKNGGPGIARNAGWDAASQPWIAFLDADDVWHDRKLEIQWAWIQANPDAVLCGHGSELLSETTDLRVAESPAATRLTTFSMLVSNRLPTRSVMLRRDLTFRFGGKQVTEDYLLWLDVVTSGAPVYRLDACLAFSLRPEFSPGGYSGQLWAHECRELKALVALRDRKAIGRFVWGLASLWSVAKYVRRYWLMRGAM